MIKMTLYDGITPLLDEMVVRVPNLARESLQVAGSIVAKRARQELLSETTEWYTRVVNGKRRTVRGPSHVLGVRVVHKTGETASPKNMASFINFYMSPRNPYVVTIGGAHPDFNPLRFRDGEVVGSMGTVKGVGKIGASIIHKLNTGELNQYHPYRNGTWIPNARYKQRGFMERAFFSTQSQVERAVAKRFVTTFHSAINDIHVKRVERRTAV